MNAWVYMLRCADNSYYVGTTRITLEQRVAEHNAGIDPKSYTCKRRPVELVFAENFLNITDAIAVERQIKGWRRAKKEALIEKAWEKLPDLARTARPNPASFDKLRMRVKGKANSSASKLVIGELSITCTLGRAGIVAAAHKREGDGATPAGIYPIRAVYYRADRIAKPVTQLPVQAIHPDDGWCDAPGDPAYNCPVKLPYPASHEELWRADPAYDVVVVIGYNDTPVVPGKGSCIFLHLNHADGRPTAGCVGLNLADMLYVLTNCGADSMIEIADPGVTA